MTTADPTPAYEADSTLALVARQVSAAIEASRREIDAPAYPTDAERVAWADGYTQACDDIRTAIRAVASDGANGSHYVYPTDLAEREAERHCTCADLLPVDQEYAPCPVHGWAVEPERNACRQDVWDGPYRMTCGRVLIDGKCGRHG